MGKDKKIIIIGADNIGKTCAIELEKRNNICDLHIVVGSTVYDCDECIKYPCALQEWSSDKNKKLRLGDCGERVIKVLL